MTRLCLTTVSGAFVSFVLSLPMGCGAAKTDAQPTVCAGTSALVAVSDYASSGVGRLALDGGGALSFGVDLGKDPALTVSQGRAFFVARDGDAIFEVDPRCGTAIARI